MSPPTGETGLLMTGKSMGIRKLNRVSIVGIKKGKIGKNDTRGVTEGPRFADTGTGRTIGSRLDFWSWNVDSHVKNSNRNGKMDQ